PPQPPPPAAPGSGPEIAAVTLARGPAIGVPMKTVQNPSDHNRCNARIRRSFVTRNTLAGLSFHWWTSCSKTTFRRVLGALGLASVLAVCVVSVGMSGGCVDQAAMRHEIESARQDLGGLRGILAAREQALSQALDDPSAPADIAAGWRAQLVVVQDQLAATEHALHASAQYDADPAGGPITRTVGAVAPFVPEPYRLPLVLGAGLAASLARGVQLRRAGRAIAQGVQRALDADPQLASRFAQNSSAVRAGQPKLARRIVDEAQGKRAALPI
ncbi:MAG: hypothetical protein AAFV77_13615, partial [Planctomycetota bacterium]